MINDTIFVCVSNFSHGFLNVDEYCVFIKGNLYNFTIDKKNDTIKIIDDNCNWIKFHTDTNFSKTILENFIELKKYRKQKLQKINLKPHDRI